MEKRKRKPGAGRPPGEFGKLGAVMSLRLPEDLRDQLKRSGKRNQRSMSAELIFRAKDSFERESQQLERDMLALLKERGWKSVRKPKGKK